MRADRLIRKEIGRRDFLVKAGRSALAVGGACTLEGLLSNCTSTGAQFTFEEPSQVVYPRLSGHKVQPPDDGCLVGVRHARRGWWYLVNQPEFMSELIEQYGNPSIFTILHDLMYLETGAFPSTASEILASEGVIPFVYAPVGITAKLKDIANGKRDDGIRRYAKRVQEFGEKNGGFFLSTMREMNGNWFPWGQKPTLCKDTWRRIWNICEEEGANHYATWVWEVSCVTGRGDDIPSRYYPGDQYVDWIGLSAYSRPFFGGHRPFSSLVGKTYRQMRIDYPHKPITMAEFGATKGKRQPEWINNAFETIEPWRGMKAAIYWDNVTIESKDDHTLSEESFEVLTEIFKDPYFI